MVEIVIQLFFPCGTSESRKRNCFFIESFPQMCCEGKRLQNRLRAEKNESILLLAVDIQGHQRGGFCIAPNVIAVGPGIVRKVISYANAQIGPFLMSWRGN